MKVTRKHFGSITGEPVYLYTLDNGQITIEIMTYGGIIRSLKVPDKKGHKVDIALGYNTLEEYKTNPPYFGAIIGRTAGRIAGGKFAIGENVYQLPKNEAGIKTLHGGIRGFDKYIWDSADKKDSSSVSLTLSRISCDMEEGYPGNLNVVVTYKLTAANEFSIDYLGTTDKPTPVNLTNHTYFNLNGEASGKDILGNILWIDADSFVPLNKESIPTGKLQSVQDTPMDFRKETPIGKRIKDDFEQIKQTKGYDHPWVLNRPTAKKVSVTTYSPESGIKMEISTDQPAAVIYTSNFLSSPREGKSEFPYPDYYAFCIETQGYPDAVNQPAFPSTLALPKKPYRQQTVWKFSVIQ